MNCFLVYITSSKASQRHLAATLTPLQVFKPQQPDPRLLQIHATPGRSEAPASGLVSAVWQLLLLLASLPTTRSVDKRRVLPAPSKLCLMLVQRAGDLACTAQAFAGGVSAVGARGHHVLQHNKENAGLR